jgi:demethylmenaquinone methyltransferase/2-methoxy-6-polyprenyl-1,4-benzoquinol methylase
MSDNSIVLPASLHQGATDSVSYSESQLAELFDRIAPIYWAGEYLSFGLNTLLRRAAVNRLVFKPGDVVCDMMCGTGLLWPLLLKALGQGATIIGFDLSEQMLSKSKWKRLGVMAKQISVARENACRTSMPLNSADVVISAFGYKTLDSRGISEFAAEIDRILKPGGRFAVVDYKLPSNWLIRTALSIYLSAFVPILEWLYLGRRAGLSAFHSYLCNEQPPELLAAELRRLGREVRISAFCYGLGFIIHSRL